MSQAALQQIQSGLAGAHVALQQGDYTAMHAALGQVLDALAEVTRAGFVPRQDRAAQPWDEVQALQLVWQLLARLQAAGCRVFPYAGTLLGLERDGRLLPNDKDADFAVWLEDFALAGQVLQQLGLQRATDVPPFDNMATYVDPRSACTVDLFGLRRRPAGDGIEGGVWLYGRPASHQRIAHLPWFTLELRTSPAGAVWWPAPASLLLEGMYGDWRMPQPEWDAQISNPAVHELNLCWHCLARKSLVHSWLSGDLARTARLFDQVLARAGADAQLLQWRSALQ